MPNATLADALYEYAASGGKSLTPLIRAMATRAAPAAARTEPVAAAPAAGPLPSVKAGRFSKAPSAEYIIRNLAAEYGLDPDAVVAVALGEGGLVNREGDIGDLSGGGSYGPFQLYAQGALPARFRGNPTLADTWAWSPEGIAYALSRMVQAGARGLRGPAAVETIIRRFERPADPNTSVARALARYRQLAGG